MPIPSRGDIFYAELDPVIGSEQGGGRPVLVIQNDIANSRSPTVIAAALTSKTGKCRLPTHVQVSRGESGLRRTSVVLLEQIRTLDKKRLGRRIGSLSRETMERVDRAIAESLGLGRYTGIGIDDMSDGKLLDSSGL